MFFDILKNYCMIEALHIKAMSKLEVVAIELFMVVAWRNNHLMRVGGECPYLQASLLLEPDEWAAADLLKEMESPKNVPTINEVVRLIAILDGL